MLGPGELAAALVFGGMKIGVVTGAVVGVVVLWRRTRRLERRLAALEARAPR